MLRAQVVLVIAVAVAACGKTEESSAVESKASGAAAPASTASVAARAAKPPVKAASRGPERTVYSLVDNRLSAHLTRGGGLVVPAGSAGFAKYVRFANMMGSKSKKAWELRQTEGELKVARMTGKSATVFVPLTAA